MKLVEPLASGIAAAAAGMAKLYQRGTTTAVAYYKDFEATQQSSGNVALDSYGSAVVYVDQLVDVQVYDSTGTLVREFVAGDYDAAVEVISPSFTGTSYADGSSGTSKPTTLEKVLDAWVASAGATDWNVKPTGGSAITLSAATAALQGLFFNVKTYGAIGNGSADDSSAIQAAYSAANTAGTGFVFFPPGTYRSAASLTIPGGVGTMGSGGNASKLLFDGALIGLSINANTALTVVKDMLFGCQTTANSQNIVTVASSGRTHFLDCTFGGNSATAEVGRLVQLNGAASAFTETTFERCSFFSVSSSSAQFQLSIGGEQIVRAIGCDFINAQTRGLFPHINAVAGTSIIGCRFDSSTVNSLGTQYIALQGGGVVYNGAVVIGCQFGPNTTTVPVAMANTSATPTQDFFEYGNSFGAVPGFIANCLPYSSSTDGYAPLQNTSGFKGSRSQFREFSAGGASVTANPKYYGTTVIKQSAGAAMSLGVNLGSPGDMWLLRVMNTSGGALTVTPGGQILLDAGATTFSVANNGARDILFAWVANNAGTTPGQWSQVATSTTG